MVAVRPENAARLAQTEDRAGQRNRPRGYSNVASRRRGGAPPGGRLCNVMKGPGKVNGGGR